MPFGCCNTNKMGKNQYFPNFRDFLLAFIEGDILIECLIGLIFTIKFVKTSITSHFYMYFGYL